MKHSNALKGVVSCSYCGSKEHTKYEDCPSWQVDNEDWEDARRGL